MHQIHESIERYLRAAINNPETLIGVQSPKALSGTVDRSAALEHCSSFFSGANRKVLAAVGVDAELLFWGATPGEGLQSRAVMVLAEERWLFSWVSITIVSPNQSRNVAEEILKSAAILSHGSLLFRATFTTSRGNSSGNALITTSFQEHLPVFTC